MTSRTAPAWRSPATSAPAPKRASGSGGTLYYAQDTWRANPKLTLNYGLRLDVINPQAVNEAGNGTWVVLVHWFGPFGGVGDIDLRGNVENRLNWAPRLGATYQLNDKTVIRGGYGRSYDIGVFGSLFGHTVTQNLPVLAAQNMTGPSQFASVFNLAQGPPAPPLVQPNADGTFVWPDGIKPLVVPRKQRPPEVDAWNITVQRQLSDTVSVEIAYVGNYGRHVFAGDNPDENLNQVALEGFLDGVPCNQRRPFFAGGVTPNVLGVGGNYGWTQTVQGYPNEAHNWYKALQTKFTRRSEGLVGAGQLHAAARHQLRRRVVDLRSGSEQGSGRVRPDAQLHHGHDLRAAVRPGQALWQRLERPDRGLLGGWQLNTNVFILSGTPFENDLSRAGQDRDTGSGRTGRI